MSKTVIISAIIILLVIGMSTILIINRTKIIQEDFLPAILCEDSDGKDFHEKGITLVIVIDAGEELGQEIRSFEDYCDPNGYLTENYCEEKMYIRATVQCKKDCVDGACV